jgi:8-oxo-dGTP pyrophosphatase MutT (NUDIX family)
MEEGEPSLAVGARELLEETGIGLEKINVLGTYPLPSRKYQKQNKVLESFLVTTDTDFSTHSFSSNLVEGKGFPENDQWKWFSLPDAEKVIHESQRSNIEVISGILVQSLRG